MGKRQSKPREEQITTCKALSNTKMVEEQITTCKALSNTKMVEEEITICKASTDDNPSFLQSMENVASFLQSMDNVAFSLIMDTVRHPHECETCGHTLEREGELLGIETSPVKIWCTGPEDFGSEVLTSDELNQCVFIGNEITLEGIETEYSSVLNRGVRTSEEKVTAETIHTYKNSNGFFTIKEVVECIRDFEYKHRRKTCDNHHTFYEGMKLNDKGDAYQIDWGS